ncbi:hypothetical protein GCM10007972_01510 [Iodidimonas muriae]|uniref:Uncharacterized protein n=1 Tax=Iodidimonas muriae TaxID=261467 RepID=A0ABQ2L636_9PROT|nr:hypothetical protein [Iodidimonas muriae]GER06445.1 hypothetical protein JCM17843_07550 [Kordiimonadales bacterium JCM 17843]GGO04801.1 hypothetical protein GCM10007972_01510 [Iodidimonas muriae]
MLSSRLLMIIPIVLGGGSLASCAEFGEQSGPNNKQVEAALRHHYDLMAQAVGPLDFQVEREIRETFDETLDDETDEEEVQIVQPRDREDCTEMQMIIRKPNGEETTETFRVPCDVLDKARIGLQEGLRAMEEAFDESAVVFSRKMARFSPGEFDHAKKIACVAAKERPGYVCDSRVWMSFGKGEPRVHMVTARFVYDGDDWLALEVDDSRFQ